jgi:hypothetical protein
VVKNIHSPSKKKMAQSIETVSESEKIARLASWFIFLLAKPEFHSHLASWRVVIRTPNIWEN